MAKKYTRARNWPTDPAFDDQPQTVCTNSGDCFEFSDPCSSCLSERERTLELEEQELRLEEQRLIQAKRMARGALHPERIKELVRIDEGRAPNYTRIAPRSQPPPDLIETGGFGPGLTKKDREVLLAERKARGSTQEDAGASSSDGADGNLNLSELQHRREVPNGPLSRDEIRKAAGQ
jgi:hypothetical protein